MEQEGHFSEGERLKRWLKKNGITQAHVARQLNVTRNTVLNWCGREQLQPHVLKQLAAKFPDIVDEFAHVAGWLYRGAAVRQHSIASEPAERYGYNPTSAKDPCRDLLDEMSRNYMRLQVRYDEVVSELLHYKDTYGIPGQPGAKPR